MSKTYSSYTVEGLIEALEQMPEDRTLSGLSNYAYSYRGYYQHVAIEPSGSTTAGGLSKYLKSRIGDTMKGWKGGDFEFRLNSYVFLAYEGDVGPSLAGFTDEGEPIVFEEVWY